MSVQWAAAQKESLAYLSSEESDVQSTEPRMSLCALLEIEFLSKASPQSAPSAV